MQPFLEWHFSETVNSDEARLLKWEDSENIFALKSEKIKIIETQWKIWYCCIILPIHLHKLLWLLKLWNDIVQLHP